jgi:pantoate--beta-alanine ligase
MGSLHDGHLSLIDWARSVCDETVVSIFVNRLQFSVGEDFDVYPRDLERDLERAAARGARLVFAPSEAVIYPAGEPRVHVDPGDMGSKLCGGFRPGHFRGVLTVVAKLLGLVRPDVAVFGRKDFQQCVLMRNMAEDLDQGVRIEIAPLVRETEGLAISSRNLYLSRQEREDALGISRGLFEAERLFRGGERRVTLLLNAIGAVVAAHPGLCLQYVACVNPDTLDLVEHADAGSVVAIAAFSGRTRLIDNVVLGDDASDRFADGSTIDESRG